MSTGNSASLSIGIRGAVIMVVAAGELRAGDTVALNEYLLPYVDQAGAGKRVYIDLSCCDYMDSTFIGFITALTSKCRRKACDLISVVNPSEKARAALRKLAAMGELHIIEAAPDMTIPLFAVASAKSSFNSRKNIELIFEAHHTLSELSAENRVAFTDLLVELKQVLDQKGK